VSTQTADPSHREPGVDPSHLRRCTASSRRQAGERCRAYAIRGASVCKVHGGSAPAVRAAAERRVARAEAVAALQLVGRPVQNADPAALLLDEIAHTAGSVQALRGLLAELDPNDVVLGGGRPYLDLYAEQQQSLMKYAELGARLGLEQRRTALAEALSGLVVGLIRNVLTAAGLTQEQHAAAMTALPPAIAELRAQLDPQGRTT
jgi:hypothetical protein